MREILFRAKERYSGVWVEGALLKDNVFTYILSGNPKVNVGLHVTTEVAEVLPKTVGQFTGLHDKNGKMIFEGDILRDGKGCDGVVTYIESVACFMAVCDMNDAWGLNEGDPKRPPQLQYTEIIGNIHDNPKLGEGGTC